MKISVITPVHNEAGNLPQLHQELSSVLSGLGHEWEIIAINDLSSDGSDVVLEEIAASDPKFKVIHFRTNQGQTAAWQAGIDHATGDTIIMIDSDLENNPADIPALLEKLSEGYDIVSGIRQGRWSDQKILRRFPSVVANKLILYMTGVTIKDHGCSLKVYRREVFDNIRLYGEMHRLIIAYLARNGVRIAEIPVDHRPRTYGESKYGFSRVFRVLLDLVLIKFLRRYMHRPMHFFGGLGFVSLALGVTAGISAIVLKFAHYRDFVATPLPVFSALLLIVGVVLVSMGILAEMVMRVYYEGQGKRPYVIRRTTNFSD